MSNPDWSGLPWQWEYGESFIAFLERRALERRARAALESAASEPELPPEPRRGPTPTSPTGDPLDYYGDVPPWAPRLQPGQRQPRTAEEGTSDER